MLNINHVSATPVGMKVRAVAKVTAVDGRKISFELKAYDESGLIGEGTHDRFIVSSEKFMSKTNAKLIR
jgi:predicted thioesterase